MANNKVTVDVFVKCDGEETQVQLVKDKDEVTTIFVLRRLLQVNSKKYPVVLYKGKRVPKLKAPIPTDGNELLHFISKIGKI